MRSTRTKRFTVRSMVLATMFLALALAGVTVALADDEPFVYDSVIGETVPAALDAGLQDAIGDPNSPTGDGGAVVSGPAYEQPDPYAASISAVDGDGSTPPPFGPDTLIPTNAWSIGDSTGATIVYAGANGENEGDGALIQTRLTYNDGTDDTDIHFVAGSGAITILGFSGSTLSWTSESSAFGTYDVNTQTVTVKNCGGPSQIPCPT